MHFVTFCVLATVMVSFANCKDCTTQACLTALYNCRVTYAELYTRSLSSFLSSSIGKRGGPFSYGLKHAGVVVTVANGDRWLIHKGSDYGDSSSTVITDAGYMSSSWTRIDRGSVYGHTVNDFMIAAQINHPYHLTGPNCQTAAQGMWELVNQL